jgi:glycine hydroxymethyltransferase
MKEDQMKTIAGLISKVLHNVEDENVKNQVREEVRELTSQFPLYRDRLDEFEKHMDKITVGETTKA